MNKGIERWDGTIGFGIKIMHGKLGYLITEWRNIDKEMWECRNHDVTAIKSLILDQ